MESLLGLILGVYIPIYPRRYAPPPVNVGPGNAQFMSIRQVSLRPPLLLPLVVQQQQLLL